MTDGRIESPLFGSELWAPALDKYSAVTGLTVELFDVEGRIVPGPVCPTPLYALFREYGYETGLFAECARRCLRQTDARPAVIGAEYHGLTVVGTSLVLDGAIVGAAVGGYALARFSQVAVVQRWAGSAGVPFARLWDIVRRLSPMPERRLRLHGELLQVLGDALLRENLHTRQYENAAALLGATNSAKDEFLAVLSHELRTPLVPIMGWASILRKHEGSEQVRQAGEVIERNALAQRRMIEDLLDMNLIEHGTVKLDSRKHDLRGVVHEALEATAPILEKKAIRVEVTDAREPLCVEGDAVRLQQIFRNILSNAVKFTPAGGAVRVNVAREADEAVVVVRDTGIGIAPEFLPFAFEMFRQQERGTRRNHEGLGIGLALVKRLIQLHGGTVAISSEGVGRGAVVTVRLPRLEALPDTGVSASIPAVQPASLALAGVAILVVEDSADARESLQLLLELHGATVSVARDGREALDMVLEVEPDLVLCDLRMPLMDGYEFIHELQQRPDAPPVVAMSGLASDADRRHTTEAGFEAHIAKPYETAALVETVNLVIEFRKHGRGSTGRIH